MIDEIFKSRFIEEIVKIAAVKDKKTKLKMRFFALLSFLLAFGGTIGTFELVINAIKQPDKRYLMYFVVIMIVLGFAITFWLTFTIFVMAYRRNAKIRSCLENLICRADRNEVFPGSEIIVDVEFKLVKRTLNEVKLALVCQKETLMQILDVKSVSKEEPFKKEILLAQNLAPDDSFTPAEPYTYRIKLTIPDDAMITQNALTRDKAKITWGINIYFDFVDWYSYDEHIPLDVRN